MKNPIKTLILLSAVLFAHFANAQTMSYTEDRGYTVDERSYQIGMLTGFAEFVKQGLKPMAVSTSFSSEDMDVLFPDMEIMAKRLGVKVYRDNTPLETDLFPFSRAEIVVIYMGDVLEQYQAVKAEKAKLLENNAYTGAPRRQIAEKFGKLMGYDDAAIENWLNPDH